ncbi:MAG: ribosomal protein S18-alanine N-acetyltransferase [Eubacteriales bacterium]
MTTIVPMTHAHLQQVADLEQISFSRPWSLEQLTESLDKPEYSFLVAEDEEKNVMGFGSIIVVADEGYINNISVYPEHKRKGIASSLLRAFCNQWERKLVFLTLEVRKSNHPAIALYQKFGFVQLGERKNYYEEPVENALILTKNFWETKT